MFTYTRKARYHETDQMGIIHHSNYVKWMEEARIEYMDSVGLGYRAMEEEGIASPVVGITVDYKKAVRFDDLVEVRVSVSRYTGASIELHYEFFNATAGYVCTLATSRHAFVKGDRLVSLKRLKPELHARLLEEISA